MFKDVTGISQWLNENDIKYELNADLAKKTWIKNGGIAQVYITPEKISQLERVLLKLSELGEKYIVIGHTSNMFFSNSYNPAIILSTRKVNNFIIEGNKIICECGASLTKVAKLCVKEGIAGYQGLVGIPGTVGAAVFNNSGAYECEMSNIVERVEVLLANGEKVWLTNSDLEYSYRDSAIKSGKIRCCVLRVEMCALFRKKLEILQAMVEEYAAIRKKYYESYDRNLGTVFSRMDIFSGRILLNILLKIHRYLTMLLPLNIQNKTRIFLILAYFNKLKLYPYISEKRINCFIWNKKKAYDDRMFYDYIKFIKSKSNTEAVLELQIIDEAMDSGCE
jgi:UDP-N-acetylmuramate dehydrogenase